MNTLADASSRLSGTNTPLASPRHGRMTAAAAEEEEEEAAAQLAKVGSTSSSSSSPSRPSRAHTDVNVEPEWNWRRWPSPSRRDARETKGGAGAYLPSDLANNDDDDDDDDGRRGGRGVGRIKMLGQWRVGDTVGVGTSGRVRIARSVVSGQFAAVKKIKRAATGTKHRDAICREISIMKLVKHRYIVQLKDVFETSQHLFLVTDYCAQGECYNYIVRHHVGRAVIHRWFAQLISALAQLHSIGIAHRDIKFENMFLFSDTDDELSIKLGDLGMASYQPPDRLLETSCGSPHYAAPEVIAGKPYDGKAADMWSSGVVLYALHARQLPFDDDHIPTLLSTIKKGVFDWHSSITGSARDLISSLLTLDVDRRLTVDEVQNHQYLTKRKYRAPSTMTTTSSRFEDAEPSSPVSVGDLDQDVLRNLHVVLRARSVSAAAEEVLYGSGTARQFYTTLLNFKTKPSSKDEPDTPAFFSGRRRSLSLPDFPCPPSRNSSMRTTASKKPSEATGRGRQLRPPLGLLSPNVPDSAPPSTLSFPAPTLSARADHHKHTWRSAPASRARVVVRPDKENESSVPHDCATPHERLESLFDTANDSPLSPAIEESQMHSKFETDSESQKSLVKKRSLQAKIRSFFKRDESSPHSEPNSPWSPQHTADSPLPASPSQISLLKRSNGYSSLQRAVVGLAPGSPSPSRPLFGTPLSEFGVVSIARPQDMPKLKTWRRRSSLLLGRGKRDSVSTVGTPEESSAAAMFTVMSSFDRVSGVEQQGPAFGNVSSVERSPGKKRPTPLQLASSSMGPAHGTPSSAPIDHSSPSSNRSGSSQPPLSALGVGAGQSASRSPPGCGPVPLVVTSKPDPHTGSSLGSPFQLDVSESPSSASAHTQQQQQQLLSTISRLETILFEHESALSKAEADNAALRNENDTLRARLSFATDSVETSWAALNDLRNRVLGPVPRRMSADGRYEVDAGEVDGCAGAHA